MKIHPQSQKNHVRTVVYVAGNIRSGSSMTTRILNICGMNLGPDLNILGPDNVGNPAGYWENVNFLLRNNLITQSYREELGRFIVQIPNKEVEEVSLKDAYKMANDFLRTELNGNFVGWKDPANSLTMWFWKN